MGNRRLAHGQSLHLVGGKGNREQGDNDGGRRYLEAAPEDVPGGNYQWGGCGTFCHTSPAIGAGAANTAALAAHDHGTPLFGAGTHPAAKACAD